MLSINRMPKFTISIIKFAVFLFLSVACTKHNTRPSSNPPAIGSFFRGGIVGYIYEPKDIGYEPGESHGIIVALNDQGKSIWGCYEEMPPLDEAIGRGLANTNWIIAFCTEPDIAARRCKDLNFNGYNDWYLPSICELQVICDNLTPINIGLISKGGKSISDKYWSSSQLLDFAAFGFDFSNQNRILNDFNKSDTNYVRAIRAF